MKVLNNSVIRMNLLIGSEVYCVVFLNHNSTDFFQFSFEPSVCREFHLWSLILAMLFQSITQLMQLFISVKNVIVLNKFCKTGTFHESRNLDISQKFSQSWALAHGLRTTGLVYCEFSMSYQSIIIIIIIIIKCWGKSLWSLVEIWTYQKTATK